MEQGIITYENLKIEIPLDINRVTDLKIKQSLNNHGKAYIKALINTENAIDNISRISLQDNIKIKFKGAEKEEILFSGIITNIEITHKGDVYSAEIEAYTYSFLMDLKLKSRSFQNKENLYGNIIKQVMADYSGSVLDQATKDRTQNMSIIQYEETDWSFIKRIASHVGAVVYPFAKGDKPQLYIGIPVGTTYKEEMYDYKIHRDIEAYLKFRSNAGEAYDIDFVTYEIESLYNYEIGDKVVYKKLTFTVIKKVSELIKGRVIHRYSFKREVSIKQAKIYNEKLQGVQIEGKVIEVKGDYVKVHLSIDKTQEIAKAYAYKFATSYVAEGQTGWYCMPEVGSSVMLYCPLCDEAAAYVSKINREDGEENEKVEDPDIKYFGTAYGKEMKLTPSSVVLSSEEEMLHITMADGEGIKLISQEDIALKGSKNMTLTGNEIKLKAGNKIILKTEGASIVVDQIVHIKS